MKCDREAPPGIAPRTRFKSTKGRVFHLELLKQRIRELVEAGYEEYLPALKLAEDDHDFADLDLKTIKAITRAARNLVSASKRAAWSLPPPFKRSFRRSNGSADSQ